MIKKIKIGSHLFLKIKEKNKVENFGNIYLILLIIYYIQFDSAGQSTWGQEMGPKVGPTEALWLSPIARLVGVRVSGQTGPETRLILNHSSNHILTR